MDLVTIGLLIREIALPLFLVAGGLYVAGKTPIGKSLLKRGEQSKDTAEAVRDLEDRVAELETQLVDAQERLDFTERLLPRPGRPPLEEEAPEQTGG